MKTKNLRGNQVKKKNWFDLKVKFALENCMLIGHANREMRTFKIVTIYSLDLDLVW